MERLQRIAPLRLSLQRGLRMQEPRSGRASTSERSRNWIGFEKVDP